MNAIEHFIERRIERLRFALATFNHYFIRALLVFTPALLIPTVLEGLLR